MDFLWVTQVVYVFFSCKNDKYSLLPDPELRRFVSPLRGRSSYTGYLSVPFNSTTAIDLFVPLESLSPAYSPKLQLYINATPPVTETFNPAGLKTFISTNKRM